MREHLIGSNPLLIGEVISTRALEVRGNAEGAVAIPYSSGRSFLLGGSCSPTAGILK